MRNREQERSELSRRLTIAIVTPVLLLIIMGSILGFQMLRMADEARWVDHTDEVIATATLAQKQIIDQETGARGYLVTEDRTFLEPLEKSHPGETIEKLRQLVADNPVEVARVDELGRRYEFRYSRNALPIDKGEGLAAARSSASMRESKREMDEVRTTVDSLLYTEGSLRHTRGETSKAATTLTKQVFLGLFGAAAFTLAFLSRRQLNAIATTFTDALRSEESARKGLESQEWIREGQMKLSESMMGDLTLEELGTRALKTLSVHVGADVGALFTREGQGWKRRAGHALDSRAAGRDTFAAGEGLVGAAADGTQVVHLKDVPSDFFKVRSGTGERLPVEVAIVPARVEQTPQAVLELGFMNAVDPRVVDLLARVGESVAAAVRSTEYKERLRDLLEESQRLTEELQAQQEELRVSNEELEEQTSAVRAAQAEAEKRQLELEEANARLEEQTNALTRSERELTQKAAEVERESRYKSEFLANMSHELRTPLNSSLILAKLLADNKDGNLTDEQVKFAQTISLAGNDLLVLINDILDLSKIEAGKIELVTTDASIRKLTDGVMRTFEPVARERGLNLSVELDDGVPTTIETDAQRVEQILKNLLSNALKFTEKGGVSLKVSANASGVRFAVRDTGIGIAKDQQQVIFDAFKQADSASNRKYGGTGLGLSISRDLARLLGGAIEVESNVGGGSLFTFTLPFAKPSSIGRAVASREHERIAPAPPPPALFATTDASPAPSRTFEDDRASLDRKRRLLLVIEDDAAFAKILFDLAHEQQFQCVVAHDADSGLALAKQFVPSAIVLDMNLPDHSGISVLDRLKHDAKTRHVPVHVVSVEDLTQTALSMGAVGYMLKPVKRDELIEVFQRFEDRLSRRMRRILVVEDDPIQRDALLHLLVGPDIEVTAVGTATEALEKLRTSTVDCVVTDLTLPDTSGFVLLEQMGVDDTFSFPPVIVYTGRSLTNAEEQRLRRYSSSIIVKGARSPERLLDEVTLFLHQVESDLPPDRQRMLRKARDREAVFDGRRILIVEDDVRNVFALSSVLEPKGMKVSIARNGREALDALETTPDIDLVLMDIMMPEMDGVEAIQRIRQKPAFARLPIIALTAKAMRDDRERCMKAGANDYIPKPLDVEMLLSLLRVWMPK